MELPPEIMVKVFENLNFYDLKTAMLVSKYWKAAAEDKTLWKNFNLNMKMTRNFNALKLLESPRFSAVENLSLQGVNHSFSEIQDEHLKLMSKLKVKHLSLYKISVQKTSPDLFSKVLNRIEKVELSHITNFTKMHIKSFFNVLEIGSNIKTLRFDNLADFDASEIDPEIVGISFNKLEVLEMFSTKFDSGHLKCIFGQMNENTNLKLVSFWDQNLSNIDPDFLAEAVHRLQIAKLMNAHLSTVQMERIFRRIGNFSYLRVLDLGMNANMKFVDGRLKMEATMTLEQFDCDTWPAIDTEAWATILRTGKYFVGDFDFD